MSATRKATIGVVLCSVAALIGYDAWAFATAGEAATISDVVTSAMYSSPRAAFIIGFFVGGLTDHWFVTGKPKG